MVRWQYQDGDAVEWGADQEQKTIRSMPLSSPPPDAGRIENGMA